MKQFNEKISLMRDRPFKKTFNDPELFLILWKILIIFLKLMKNLNSIQNISDSLDILVEEVKRRLTLKK